MFGLEGKHIKTISKDVSLLEVCCLMVLGQTLFSYQQGRPHGWNNGAVAPPKKIKIKCTKSFSFRV